MAGLRKLVRLRSNLALHRHFSSSCKLSRATALTQSYVHNASQIPLLADTIGRILDQRAGSQPDAEAFVLPFQNVRKTFSQLKIDVDNLASGLLALGLQRGDRVGIWGPNSHEWILAQFATAKAGLILVNVNPAYKAHELEYCLNKVEIKALIAAENNKSLDYYEIIHHVCPEITEKYRRKHFDRVPNLEHIIMISEKEHGGFKRFRDIVDGRTKESSRRLEDVSKTVQFDDAVNIQFTSGTTGNPKGATLTHFNVVNNASFMGRILEFQNQKTRLCSPVPLYHCFGCVLGTLTGLVHGITVVIPDARFNAEATLKAVTDEKCDVIYGVPTMYADQLHHTNFNKYDTSSLRVGFMSGAPCPVELVKQVQRDMHVKNVIVGYGMTETSPLSHISGLNDPVEYAITTIGKALPHLEVKLTDPNGAIVPIGSKGEINIRGHGNMKGYWEDSEKTAETKTETGWIKSGDLGVMNEEGYVRIVGRAKDTIIRGGENVYPVEVEHVLHEHPSVAEAYVFGVPDERLGEEICCWVRVKSEVSEDELRTFCKEQLASFKVPRYFVLLKLTDEFPLTVTGKVQKFKMRELSIKQLKLDCVKGPFDS